MTNEQPFAPSSRGARALALLVSLAAWSGCGSSTPASTPSADETAGNETAREPVGDPPFRLSSDVSPTRYALTLSVDPRGTEFSGIADIDVEVARPATHFWIHALGLTVGEVTLTPAGGAPIAATFRIVDTTDGVALIELASPAPVGLSRLHIAYSGSYDRALEGLYRVNVGEDHYLFTQFEAVAARKAFPCFDEPRWKTPFDITVIHPAQDRAFANTREAERTSLGETMAQTRFRTSERLPTYLVALAIGPFDVVEADIAPNAVRTEPLHLRALAPRGRGGELGYAMRETPRIVTALETWFGIAYPFDKLDIVAVPDFSAGAMENAGLVTFRDVLLLLGDDAPERQRRGFAYVMAHELAHQWFGNLVTMEFWDDLWLNEAFATWMETPIIHGLYPDLHADEAELGVMHEAFAADSLVSARRIRQPVATVHDISNAFDSITYSKGASVLAMLEHHLGSEVFQRGIRRYLHDHARGNATTADLVRALDHESQGAIGPMLDAFTLAPGIPTLTVEPSCEGTPSLRVTQHRYRPIGSTAEDAAWTVPFCARLGTASGAPREVCRVLPASNEPTTIELEACPTWVLPNPGGHGYYRATLPAPALEALRRAITAPSRGRGAVSFSPRDRLTFADGMLAALASGEADVATTLESLAPFTASEDRGSALALRDLLVFTRGELLRGEGSTDTMRTSFARYVSSLYAPQLRRLGWAPRGDEPGEQSLLRVSILELLAREARDPAVRREAARRGRAYLGIGTPTEGTIHADAVRRDLVELALTVAAQEGGAPVLDVLERTLVATEDSLLRGQLLGAIGSVEDDTLRTRVLDLSLDARLRLNERFIVLRRQFGQPEGRALAFRWLEGHIDALLTALGSEFGGYLPYSVEPFCAHEDAEAARALFTPRLGSTQGGPRNLESAIESIELCAARAARERESARAFFARPRR